MEKRGSGEEPRIVNDPMASLVRDALGDEVYEAVYAPTVASVANYIFFYPDFAFNRQLLGNMIYGLYNDSQERLDLVGPYSEKTDANLVSAFTLIHLEWLATQVGLITPLEIEHMKVGERLKIPNISDKYFTTEDLQEAVSKWKADGKTVGLVHGAFDPPHARHGTLFSEVKQHCDILLVGVDRDTFLRQTKSESGNERPRYPLAGRLGNIAALSTVDGVFVMPMTEAISEEYMTLYRNLGIQILGCPVDHRYRVEYENHMAEIGGRVVTGRSEADFSSTLMVDLLSLVNSLNPDFHEPSLRNVLETLSERAIKLGFLRDYPQGT